MFIEQTIQGKNSLWRYLLGLILVIAFVVLANFPIVLIQALFKEDLLLPSGTTNTGYMTPNSELLIQLFPFITGFCGILLVVKWIHHRPILSLVTPTLRFDGSRFFFSFGLWFGLTFVAELFFYLYQPEQYTFQLQWENFAILLCIALFILPIQTSFEELLIRGYLMQGIGLATRFRWIPLLATSLLFGFLHGANPEIEKYGWGIMMVFYISVGLFAGILTLMDDRLELALGMHAANNIYGAVLVSYEGSALSTPSLFTVNTLAPLTMYLMFLISAILYVIIINKKYQWKSWKSLLQKIDPQEIRQALD
ncbi:type II CAAX endopeptidase family protein [Rapidithrix thailandica]|uniref:Type II CAAX endopeptidase family protein n=1 Tax=Rapidithrix thailandica TaxID=413964 RepID=A0AAW9S4I2_9BACT